MGNIQDLEKRWRTLRNSFFNELQVFHFVICSQHCLHQCWEKQRYQAQDCRLLCCDLCRKYFISQPLDHLQKSKIGLYSWAAKRCGKLGSKLLSLSNVHRIFVIVIRILLILRREKTDVQKNFTYSVSRILLKIWAVKAAYSNFCYNFFILPRLHELTFLCAVIIT